MPSRHRELPHIVEVTTEPSDDGMIICPCCEQLVNMVNGEIEWHRDPTVKIVWPCTGSCSSLEGALSFMEFMIAQRAKEQSEN